MAIAWVAAKGRELSYHGYMYIYQTDREAVRVAYKLLVNVYMGL